MIISGVDFCQSPCGRRATAACRWFADLQPLPLSYGERERLKAGGPPHILAWYARSLANRHYDVLKHPSFYDYACGVMASEFGWATVKNDKKLQKRFPPRHLNGLGPGLQWLPPKQHAEAIGKSATKPGTRCLIPSVSE
jgi:hypothetical protein